MGESFIHAWLKYWRGSIATVRSMARAAATVLPYAWGWGEHRKQVTEQYPDPVSSRTDEDLPPRTRGLLFNDIDRCTGCLNCSQVCPVQCIKIELEPGPDSLKPWVSVFDIDFAKCIFCGACVEVCEPGSLVHSKKFEGAAFELSDLVTGFGRGHVSREQRDKWELIRDAESLR